MRKLTYFVGSTIDGYIAGPHGEVDFFPLGAGLVEFLNEDFPETLPTHVRKQLGIDAPNRRFDTAVMGRHTYQPALDVGITNPYAHLRQYVVSSTLPASADPNVEVVKGDPLGLVRELKRQSGLGIWLCGGGTLAGALLPEIDELIVKLYPVVAGAGIRVFEGQFQPSMMDLVDTRPVGDGALVLTYKR